MIRIFSVPLRTQERLRLYLHVVPSGTNIFLTLFFYQHVVPSGTEMNF
ncbi:MAG: hypothetical protein LBP59_11545 [Planctomycetaceae bacterium]|nr:hypothetical protein [Planctomycetaceae bacterium]